jgi:zinc protease
MSTHTPLGRELPVLLALAASLTAISCAMLDAEHRGPGAAAGAPARALPYPIQHHELANGLGVYLVSMPSDGLVSYWSIVRTGSRDEVEPGVTGFAHFFEHVMFKGSKNFPAGGYDRVMSEVGANFNASTWDDRTQYHASFASEDLPRVIEVEADRFRWLEYSEAEFRTEAGAVYGEYRKGRTSPFEVLFEALQNAAFDRHTYKHTTIGFEADIQAMPEHYEYSQTFFRRFYRPENTVIVVSGDFDPAAALALIEEHYGSWEPGYQAPRVEPEPEQTAQRRIQVAFDGQTLPIVCVAFKGPRFDPSDRQMLAGWLLGELGFGPTSPIYEKLVLDEQRCEFVFGSFGHSRDPGLWSVIARVKDPADVEAVEQEIWRAVAELQAGSVGVGRLDAVRSNVKYSFLGGLTTPEAVNESLAQYVSLTGDLADLDRMFATLATVTPADLRAAAARFLAPERSTVAVLASREPSARATLPAGEPVHAAFPAARYARGVEPVLLPVADDPNVVIKLWFRTGSQDDPQGKEGLASLVGDLVSGGGTRTLAFDQITERLFPLAATYGASVDKEMTVVTGIVHRDNLEFFYPLFLEAVTAPGWRDDDFARLRDDALSGIEKTLRFSSDEELGKAALYGALFQSTPYGHLAAGSAAALRGMTVADARRFWETHWTRDNVVVGLGGAYPADLPARLASDLERLPAGVPPAVPRSIAALPSGRKVLIVDKPGPATAISIGAPIDVRRGSREYYALWIANSWLGEHRNSASHLYQFIREARGMNYGDYSYIEAFPGGGGRDMPPTGVGRRSQIFEIWIRPVPPEQAVFALRAALSETEKLIRDGLSREEFEARRAFLKKYALHFAETTSARLGYAIDDRFYGLGSSHLATFRRMMDEITHEEVQAAIRKHLQLENLQIAFVAGNAAELAETLVTDAPSPISYAVEKPAELLAEDARIAVWPLGIRPEDVRIVPVAEMFAN